MRTQIMVGFFCLITLTGFGPNGCDDPELMIEAVDDGPCPQPEQEEDDDTVFTWMRDGDVLPELTAVVSLEALCVDGTGEFVLSADTRDYGWDELDGIEIIQLMIPFDDQVKECFVVLRQNEQETPDAQAPNPGRATYTLDGVDYDAPVVEAGPFAGYWRVDLRPDVD